MPLFAQISGNNLLEYQFGRLPSDTISEFSTIYDRALIDFRKDAFKAGLTLEQFWTPFSERNYIRINQVRLQYLSKTIEVKLGNFYETLGRGILLRSYEVPGSSLEDISYRSKHYFNRDIAGLNLKYRYKRFSVKGIFGWPLNNVFPPNQSIQDRRSDRIGTIYLDYSIKNHTIGTSVLNIQNSINHSWFNMISLSGMLSPILSYYAEFCKNISDFSISDFSSEASYALYLNTNIFLEKFGIAAEYKKYNNILIGAGINEPPALVREHSYRLLNRSTHVLQPINESGYQLEAYFYLPNESMLTLNNTLAINDFDKKFIFQEYFVEYTTAIDKTHEMTVFADYAEDPIKLERSRFTVGTNIEWKLSRKSGLYTDYEFQIFNREGNSVNNQLASLGYSYKSKFGTSLILEFSTDEYVVEDEYKIWPGLNFKYKITNKNTLLLFAGKRRGGPACTSGVCYEVLDFEGVEIRLTTRL